MDDQTKKGVSPTMQNQDLINFVDKLIDEKGYTTLTPEIREEMKKNILRRVDDFIMARIIAAFSDEDVLTFEKMLKEGKPESEIQDFTSTHIPDFVNFLTNVLLEFKDVYLGVVRPPLPPQPAPVSEKK